MHKVKPPWEIEPSQGRDHCRDSHAPPNGQSVRIQWQGKEDAQTFLVTPMPVFYLTPTWCPWKKETTAVNKIKMKKGHWACNAEQISQGDQNERENGTIILLCGYIAPFMETMWEFSIFAGQLPGGLWKQFRREIKGLQNRFQAWMIKWTFCKIDFTELINGWLRLSHINKLRRKIREKAENFEGV